MPYKETYHSKAIFPYDVSKVRRYDFKHMLLIYINYHITTRFSNTYGPSQLHFSALIPDLARSLINDIDLYHGECLFIDYVYINDIVDLYLLLAKNLYKPKLRGEIFNAGTNQPLRERNCKEILFS